MPLSRPDTPRRITLDNMPPERTTPHDRIDWSAIRMEYVTTWVTYKELADKYHVAKSSVEQHGKVGQWQALRDEYLARAQSRGLTDALQNAAKVYEKRWDELDVLAAHIRHHLGQKDSEGRVIVKSPDILKKLADSLDKVIHNQRLILGHSTQNHAVIAEIGGKVAEIILRYVPQQNQAVARHELALALSAGGISPVVGPGAGEAGAGGSGVPAVPGEQRVPGGGAVPV